jgi:phosphate transport system permease protein
MINRGLYARRRFRNGVFLTLSVGAAAFGIGWLAVILSTLIVNGSESMSTTLFTKITLSTGENGGLANAIFGSVIMSAAAVLVGTPIGILAGTYLAEYGRHNRFSVLVRFVNDILLSAPSILVGLFIYELVVVRMGHFSAWAGIAALAVLVVPVVVRTTENMLLLVPNTLREAAAALGTPRAFVIRTVTWRAARAGIMTGVLLAIARISGETAPLLFTSLSSNNWSTDLNAPMASLPAVIYDYAQAAPEDLHKLAWAGALLITFAVLSLSILARVFESKRMSQ